jgi:hypothetical protein
MVALLDPIVMVSVVVVGVERVTEPELLLIDPWKAWARAVCGMTAAAASAAEAQDIMSRLRVRAMQRELLMLCVACWVICSSMARAGW